MLYTMMDYYYSYCYYRRRHHHHQLSLLYSSLAGSQMIRVSLTKHFTVLPKTF
jgi:hypothetical protein